MAEDGGVWGGESIAEGEASEVPESDVAVGGESCHRGSVAGGRSNERAGTEEAGEGPPPAGPGAGDGEEVAAEVRPDPDGAPGVHLADRVPDPMLARRAVVSRPGTLRVADHGDAVAPASPHVRVEEEVGTVEVHSVVGGQVEEPSGGTSYEAPVPDLEPMREGDSVGVGVPAPGAAHGTEADRPVPGEAADDDSDGAEHVYVMKGRSAEAAMDVGPEEGDPCGVSAPGDVDVAVEAVDRPGGTVVVMKLGDRWYVGAALVADEVASNES